MMTLDELQQGKGELRQKITHLYGFLKIEELEAKRAEIETTMSAPDFWNDKESAQATVAEMSSVRNIIEPFRQLEKNIDDYDAALELAAEDEEFVAECEIDFRRLKKAMDKLEIMSFLSGKFDKNNFYFSIHAGAGGTESCDWASMLFRMYRRFFERRGWKDEIIDLQSGEEAGIKSATLHVTGDFAYGYFKAERGVHRLVRISPFDSNARRHTSFCSVEVFPELDDDIDIEIDESTLRIDTYRASGAGGQHVNRTDSAVRITHIPTGVVVTSQDQRSQIQNREKAMRVLKSRLYDMQRQKQQSEYAQERKGQIGTGDRSERIRTYNFPQGRVTDHRIGLTLYKIDEIINGALDEVIDALTLAEQTALLQNEN